MVRMGDVSLAWSRLALAVQIWSLMPSSLHVVVASYAPTLAPYPHSKQTIAATVGSLPHLLQHGTASATTTMATTKLAARTSPTSSSSSSTAASSSNTATPLERRFFYLDDQKKQPRISYTIRPASPGFRDAPPILLIHPVGIGLSSWFYDRLMLLPQQSSQQQSSYEGPTMYAVNLWGCGVSEESAVWTDDDDDECSGGAQSLPIAWVEQCEKLIERVIVPQRQPAKFELKNLWSRNNKSRRKSTVAVMSQGGLAPIAILLASRNPTLVSHVVLASPPADSELLNGVPEKELWFNYNFLTGPAESVAFGLLETAWAIRFFSDLFLFGESSDEEWVARAMGEACPEVRPPVQVFNAGFCMSQSYEDKLRTLVQPLLILEGMQDKRMRDAFVALVKNCRRVRVPGQNVLPWESPTETLAAVRTFLSSNN